VSKERPPVLSARDMHAYFVFHAPLILHLKFSLLYQSFPASRKGLHADLQHATNIYPQFHAEAACVDSEGLKLLIVTETYFCYIFFAVKKEGRSSVSYLPLEGLILTVACGGYSFLIKLEGPKPLQVIY
jgi:hypothetical protein